jgi:hypothetical protein
MSVAQPEALRPAGLLCLLLLAVAGCDPAGGDRAAGRQPPPAPGTPAPAGVPAPPPDRPEEVRGTIVLEGMEEPMVYRLYRTPAGFPLPFSTYLPQDMEADAVSPGEGEGVRIVPRFGGARDESAYLALLVLPERVDGEAAGRLVRDVAGRHGRVERVGDPAPGVLEAYRFQGTDGRAGRIELRRREGRYLYLVDHAPLEMGDGWGPRVRHVLDEWRWASDGAPLAG